MLPFPVSIWQFKISPKALLSTYIHFWPTHVCFLIKVDQSQTLIESKNRLPCSNAFWPGLTPFGPLLWQAEADTELTLSASPTTTVGQKALPLASMEFCLEKHLSYSSDAISFFFALTTRIIRMMSVTFAEFQTQQKDSSLTRLSGLRTNLSMGLFERKFSCFQV